MSGILDPKSLGIYLPLKPPFPEPPANDPAGGSLGGIASRCPFNHQSVSSLRELLVKVCWLVMISTFYHISKEMLFLHVLLIYQNNACLICISVIYVYLHENYIKFMGKLYFKSLSSILYILKIVIFLYIRHTTAYINPNFLLGSHASLYSPFRHL